MSNLLPKPRSDVVAAGRTAATTGGSEDPGLMPTHGAR